MKPPLRRENSAKTDGHPLRCVRGVWEKDLFLSSTAAPRCPKYNPKYQTLNPAPERTSLWTLQGHRPGACIVPAKRWGFKRNREELGR